MLTHVFSLFGRPSEKYDFLVQKDILVAFQRPELVVGVSFFLGAVRKLFQIKRNTL